MTQEELEQSLDRKCKKNSFFSEKLDSDNEHYSRRSFNDLIEHYSKFNVTEEMLMKALKNLEFIGYYCSDPKRIVFFRWTTDRKVKFWFSQTNKSEAFDVEKNKEKLKCNFEQYTPSYLESLYDEV